MKMLLSLVMVALVSFALAGPVKLTAGWAQKDVRVGEWTTLLITLDIETPFHIYGNSANQDAIPTTLLVLPKPSSAFKVGKVSPPIAVVKHDKALGADLNIFEKKAVYKYRIQITSSEAKEVAISVNYQACDDKMCLPPTTLKTVLKLKVAPGAARPERLKA